MRILLYVHSFAPRIGGVETSTMLLARGLAEKKDGRIEITVVTPTPADGLDDAALPFRIVRRPTPGRLWRLVGETDIVHLAGPCFIPLVMGLLRRKPVVVTHHGYQAVCPNGLLFYEPTKTACPGHFMARRYGQCLRCNTGTVGRLKSARMLFLTFPRRWLCKRVVNVAITQHVCRRLGLPRSRVIYQGVPHPPPTPRSLVPCPPARPLTIAYVGRLVSEKGLPLLVRAAAHLKEQGWAFRLKFVGDGPERNSLEDLVRQTGLDHAVTFTGFVQGEALEQALADVDVVAMPSLWEETTGRAALEHMIRGRLVIASDIGGLGEVLDDAGLKFSPGDFNGLLARLMEVLKNPALVTELGEKARRRALALFRQEQEVGAYYELYRSILGQPLP